jgi:predicted tellurium resistance membrane protein TerC
MELLLDPSVWMAFAMLTALEIVLGVDNIIFLTILVNRLPAAQRDKGRKFGLGFALASRLALLCSLSWVVGLTTPLVTLFGFGISGRGIILIGGGLFLLYKASHEIFVEVEAREQDGVEGMEAKNPVAAGAKLFWGTVIQIGIIDIVFSLDSVITAVGMSNKLPVMMAAVIASCAIMIKAAKPIGDFVERHPSVKVLALSFLTMVGMALVAEGFHVEVPKGYIYASMAFSLLVEFLNIRGRAKRLAANAAKNARADATV